VKAVLTLPENEVKENAWRALDDELTCSMLWQNPQTYEEWKDQIRLLIQWEIDVHEYMKRGDIKWLL
jgi:hypothetical protein